LAGAEDDLLFCETEDDVPFRESEWFLWPSGPPAHPEKIAAERISAAAKSAVETPSLETTRR
jgi:hypothetical protein